MLSPTTLVAPISEKTVELNLTVEIVNYIHWKTGRRSYAWGPTLQQEATFGFDCAYNQNGRFFFVQYKRAYDEPGGHVFHLNRTKAKDQHQRLCNLESTGCATYYLLPLFTQLSYLAAHRGHLLVRPHTRFMRPSRIHMPGGGVGHHDLHIHSHSVWLTSDRIDIEDEEPNDFPERLLEEATLFERGDAERWGQIFSKVFGDDETGESTHNAAVVFIPS